MYTVLKSPYESAQNSYLGYTGTLKYNDFSIDTLYFDSVMERFSPNKEKFRNRNNEAIEYIAAGELIIILKNLRLPITMDMLKILSTAISLI